MSFAVFADGSANLPQSKREGIRLLPCLLTLNGREITYDGDIDHYDTHTYYEALRSGQTAHTSLISPDAILNSFSPLLAAGQDILCVAMSSGISGSFQAALNAARELMSSFPGRFVHIVDSHGCGFGSGMLAVLAARLSRKGLSAREAAPIVDAEVPHACQYFTVDDLNFLKRTGRLSGVIAAIGTMLNIKPLLFGDSTGHIVSCGNVRGRRKAIEALAARYREKRMDEDSPEVYISHGDCPADAEALAGLIRETTPRAEITVCEHEPFSGAHVGPGMLGLFFRGRER